MPLLVGVVLAVALLDPSKPFPGTDWHPWLYLREIVQLGLVAISLWFGDRSTSASKTSSTITRSSKWPPCSSASSSACSRRCKSSRVHGGELGIDTPPKFFWATGSLSSVLDNAPTYLVFFKTAQAMPHAESAPCIEAGVEHAILLAAISLGAVFMGAMTYIGNGPNFMVKAIAEKSGVKMPSFFGYMVYSCPHPAADPRADGLAVHLREWRLTTRGRWTTDAAVGSSSRSTFPFRLGSEESTMSCRGQWSTLNCISRGRLAGRH